MLSQTLLSLVAAAPVFAGPIAFLNTQRSYQPVAGLDLAPYGVESCAAASEAQYFSCEAPSAVSNTSCCYENFGIIMQTQFWDFNTTALAEANSSCAGNPTLLRPNKKKAGSDQVCLDSVKSADNDDVSQVFTIHGLWDDLCDGSYHQFCNPDLEIADSESIADLLVNDFGRRDLLDIMEKFWINNDKSNVQGGGSASLWEHEFNKHGTCFNTLAPSCFTGNYTRHQNAVAYYQKVIEVWNDLPTYAFLQGAGIVPTTEGQYALLDVQAALAANHQGMDVYVGCQNNSISEIWYYHHVKGNVLEGEYMPVNSLTNSTCPKHVWYIPK